MSMMALTQQLQSQGRGNDTILAHITPEEAQLLESRGGAGTLNPDTGLPEYGFFDDLWNGVKKFWTSTVQPLVRKLAPVIIPAVAIFFPAAIPAIGAWFGATGATAAVVGTAALSAGVTLASGGTFEQAIQGAALGAAASYITPILGAKANQLLGASLSPAVQSYLGSALVSGGIAAARGAGVRDVFTAAATGAATAYLGTLAKNYYQSINDKMTAGKLNITQKNADGSLVVAADAETYKKAGLNQAQIETALKQQGVNSEHARLAAESIVRNNSAEQTANILAEFTSKNGAAVMSSQSGKDAIAESVTLGSNQDILLRAEDAKLLAQDAVALKNQGLTEKNIQLHLEATGASRAFAIDAASGAMRGQSADAISNNLLTTANYAAGAKDARYSQGKVYDNTEYVVPREVGQVMNEQQQALADSIPYRDMVTAGTITVDQAATYADAGYAPADVTKLMSVGYNATDLQDLASVGVNARDLVTLSNTKFAEGQINDLMSGGATVTDIATTSRVIDTGKIDVATASQLLSRDISGNAITNLANRGQAQAAANSTLSGSTIDRLATGGFDINRAVALQNSGTNVDQLISENRFAEYNQLAAASTTAPTATATAPTAPADPTAGLVSSGTITAQEVSDLTENGYSRTEISNLISKGYTAPDLFDLAAAGVPPSTLVSLANTQFPESQINDLMSAGASANDIAMASNIVNSGKITVDSATKLLSKDLTGTQINSLVYNQPNNIDAIANSTLNNTTVSRLLDGGFDLGRAAQLANSGTDVNNLIATNNFTEYRAASAAPPGTIPVRDAAGNISYFEAATGNTLDASGRIITLARAPEVSGGTQTAGPGGFDVEISGIPGKVGQESAVRGPLTPGTVLASDADIDAGRATFNAEANAWEMPVAAPPVNEYTYTTPPGEFVGPLPPTGGDQIFVMPDGTRLRYDGTATYMFDGSFSNLGTPERFGATPETPGATTAPVTPPTQIIPEPLPPVAPPVAPPNEYTYTTPPGEVVGPPAPPAGPDSGVFLDKPGGPNLPGIDTTPPGEVVGPPAPVPVEPPVTPPSVTVPGQEDDGTIIVRAPREPEYTYTTPPGEVVGPPAPVEPPAPAPEPAPEPAPTPAPVEVITPPTPYVPVPTPPVPEDPPRRGFGNVDRLPIPDFGSLPSPGLNPGFVQPQPYYAAQNPVQSQYYYGERPYQPGPTFNQNLYDQVPAPVVPFGLQQMYTPIDLNRYLSQFTPGPVAPR